jgi:hypothetical protein
MFLMLRELSSMMTMFGGTKVPMMGGTSPLEPKRGTEKIRKESTVVRIL